MMYDSSLNPPAAVKYVEEQRTMSFDCPLVVVMWCLVSFHLLLLI